MDRMENEFWEGRRVGWKASGEVRRPSMYKGEERRRGEGMSVVKIKVYEEAWCERGGVSGIFVQVASLAPEVCREVAAKVQRPEPAGFTPSAFIGCRPALKPTLISHLIAATSSRSSYCFDNYIHMTVEGRS
jgi:hypothetical protein